MRNAVHVSLFTTLFVLSGGLVRAEDRTPTEIVDILVANHRAEDPSSRPLRRPRVSKLGLTARR